MTKTLKPIDDANFNWFITAADGPQVHTRDRQGHRILTIAGKPGTKTSLTQAIDAVSEDGDTYTVVTRLTLTLGLNTVTVDPVTGKISTDDFTCESQAYRPDELVPEATVDLTAIKPMRLPHPGCILTLK